MRTSAKWKPRWSEANPHLSAYVSISVKPQSASLLHSLQEALAKIFRVGKSGGISRRSNPRLSGGCISCVELHLGLSLAGMHCSYAAHAALCSLFPQ